MKCKTVKNLNLFLVFPVVQLHPSVDILNCFMLHTTTMLSQLKKLMTKLFTVWPGLPDSPRGP